MTNPLEFEFALGTDSPQTHRSPGAPLRILLICDLGQTCASRTEHGLETRPIRKVDIDSFETFLASEAPTLQLDSTALQMREMEDFHPDRICQSLTALRTLRDLKQRLRDPAGFDAAAQEVQALLHAPQATDGTPPPESDTDTFSRLLGAPAHPEADGSPAPSTGFLDALLKDAVAAHITADADPKAEHYVAAVDAASGAHLRAVLHNPDFQSLESAWRALDLLVSNIETDEDISIHVLNAAKAELTEALGAPDSTIEDTVLHRRLVAERAEAPFTLIVLDCAFGPHDDDVRLLASLGAFAGRSGAVVLSSVTPDMIGVPSWTSLEGAPVDGWDTLRDTPMAHHIVATAPRFMMRTPYGKKLDPIEAFPFEEVENPASDQHAFLWGGSSLLACILIAQSFARDGWSGRLNDTLTFDDLPFVPFDAGGEQQMKAGTEAELSDRAATVLQDKGVVPVLAIRNQNAVRLPWFQTVAKTNAGERIGPFNT